MTCLVRVSMLILMRAMVELEHLRICPSLEQYVFFDIKGLDSFSLPSTGFSFVSKALGFGLGKKDDVYVVQNASRLQCSE